MLSTETISRPASLSSPPPSVMYLNKHSARNSPGQTSSLHALRSLYQQAARAFLQRDAIQTQALVDRAFEIITPPLSISQDPLSSQRKKWDILRITLETTLYTSPGLISEDQQDASASSSKPLPSTWNDPSSPLSGISGKERLRSNLLLSPPSLLATLHTRSLRLFTPPSQKPSPVYLPAPILVSLVLASLKLDCPQVGRGMVEEWLARRTVIPTLPGPSSQPKTDDGYAKVLDVYCLHILPRLGEWEYATEFLRYEAELPLGQKKQLQDTLKNLHEQTLVPPPLPSHSPGSSDTESTTDSLSRPLSRVSSTSSVSSHTAVPSTPRPIVNRSSQQGKQKGGRARSRSPSESTATTVRPSRTSRPLTSTNLHHAVTASTSSSSASSTSDSTPGARVVHSTNTSVAPTTKGIFQLITSNFAWLTTTYLPALRSRLPLLLWVLIPLIGLLAQLKKRRATSTKPTPPPLSKVDEARRKLGMEAAGRSSIWMSARKAITDAVVMAGRGLV